MTNPNPTPTQSNAARAATPRTDEALIRRHEPMSGLVWADFARNLEREMTHLQQANAQLTQSRDALLKWKHDRERAVKKKWELSNQHKVRAHGLVRRALEKGELVKPPACSKCGRIAKLEGHHDDYNKPLEVRWLCDRCHADNHQFFIKRSGLFQWGKRPKNAKLTDEDVIEIRRLIEANISDASIGRLMGVNDSTIRSIRTGNTWAHIQDLAQHARSVSPNLPANLPQKGTTI